MLLTSFRRNGAGVSTPFGPMRRDGMLYCFTDARSGKVKRIRRDDRVELAPCSQRGQVLGQTVAARARVLAGDEGARMAAAFDAFWTKQFGLFWRVGRAVERLRGLKRVVIEIAPAVT